MSNRSEDEMSFDVINVSIDQLNLLDSKLAPKVI